MGDLYSRKASVSVGSARCYIGKTRFARDKLVPVPERYQFQ
jgi:hypothetical protein